MKNEIPKAYNVPKRSFLVDRKHAGKSWIKKKGRSREKEREREREREGEREREREGEREGV